MLSVAMAFGQTLNDTIAEVTVSGYHVPANISAATPMQVLSSEQLLRLGATDVGDALKHFAGVQVKDFGGVGGMKTVSIRSLGAQHTGVSYDGVSVGDCQSGQVDLSRFALSNLSSITLTVGQGDNLFVPAKQLASAATINISSQPSDTLLYIYMSAGSYGLANPSLHFGRRLKGLRLSAYGEYKYAKGDYPFRLWNGRHLIDEHRNNSDISLWRGEINLLAEPGRHQKIAAKVYGYSSVRGLPGAVIYDNPIANERLTDKNAFVQLLYENIFSRKLRLRSAAKWNYSWMKDRNADAASTRTDIFRQRETYLTATLLWQPVGCLQAALAQDFTHNYLSTTLVTCPFPSRSTWQTALSARYATGRIAINASLLATAVVETVEKGTAADNRSRLSPALSITWKPFGSNLHLRLSYKDIFRLPTLNDLYYTVIGNVNLRPEKSRQWNVGATWSCQHSGGRGFAGVSAGILTDDRLGCDHGTIGIIKTSPCFYGQEHIVGKSAPCIAGCGGKIEGDKSAAALGDDCHGAVAYLGNACIGNAGFLRCRFRYGRLYLWNAPIRTGGRRSAKPRRLKERSGRSLSCRRSKRPHVFRRQSTDRRRSAGRRHPDYRGLLR